MASASLPFLAIQRSTNSWFSRCSRLDCSSAIFSCKFNDANSSWKSCGMVSHSPNSPEVRKHTSSNLAFPLSSSSLSFRRICKCILSPSNALIRLPSCVFRFRNLSNSELTRASRSCSSARERCASVRSALVAVRVSCKEDSGGSDGCFLTVSVRCWVSAGVETAVAVRSASWVSSNHG